MILCHLPRKEQGKSRSNQPVSAASTLIVALKQADRHEESPSVLKKSRFRTKVNMDSHNAQACRDMLNLFGAKFDRLDNTNLRAVIADEFYLPDLNDTRGERSTSKGAKGLLTWYRAGRSTPRVSNSVSRRSTGT
jgi:hypothetical protein